ncbi:plexin-A1-like [Ruditapes philippinarum]|uniref:plexin-A1-like n=1 Tax=Ruditapes philippinarum TaxID=129788 RepID=UPI00295B6CF8|nr:plexin-A1-like [Ruditapes philippinarum]
MFTSSDEKHIFALSKTKVFKIPVQSCSEFVTCGWCLFTKDPYCGWCFLEERCSTRDACPANKEWISASSGEQCPHVEDITPTAMSVWEIETLNITVSNVLQGVKVSCLFHSNEIEGDFNHTEKAEVSSDGLSVKCRPTNISAIENKIKGSLEMKIAILANSSTTTIEGKFTIYRCETFVRCLDCTAKNWKCKWCPFSNQCTNRTCDNKSINTTEDCPRTINYTVVANGQDVVHDSDGSVYFSSGRSYTINITGTNLLEPKTTLNSLKYSCKIVVSGTHDVWFNRTYFNHGSLVCFLGKEGLSKITSQKDKLVATVQLMWGGSPVYGVAEQGFSVIIYTCDGLTKPAYNCGHCKSFALYQPHFNCQWCGKACVDSNEICNNTACDDPIITKVYPLSAHMNATTLIEITGVNLGSSFNDTIDSVTVAGKACDSIESGYIPGIK